MLDIKFIQENQEAVKKAIQDKGVDLKLEELLEMDKKRKELLQKIEELNSMKNDINEMMKGEKAEEEKKEILEKAKDIKSKSAQAEKNYAAVKSIYEVMMARVPNIVSEDTPVAPDESGNKVLRKWGEPTKFDFEPKDHMQLGEDLGLIDVERAVKVSGSRFNYLKGELAMLEYAIVQYTFSVLSDENILKEIITKNGLDASSKPFIPIVPPVLIKPEVMDRMARLEPKEERYHIPSDDLYLVGSAEHTLGSMYMDEILKEEELPIRYIGFSTAFRREAGSYGKDIKGILRVHQFDKLEMESFSLPENSLKEQDLIVAVQEYLMQSLGLPYQVVIICTGDMGKPDFRQIDIETWMPGQNKYRETHTSDLMTDYQTRRMNTKVQKKDGKLEFVHTNDATAFAIGRILIAILENFQQDDGSVKIPEILQKYMPGNISTIKLTTNN
jgi:seryl-tRNA synthetase